MSIMGQHTATGDGSLRRATISASFVTVTMGIITMSFQVYHSIKVGQMPWPLAWMEGIGPLLVAIFVLHFISEWRTAPWPAKFTAYAIMGAAMFMSASATGAVVLHAMAPHWSLLFGATLDAAELLAAYFLMSGRHAAQAARAAALEEAVRAAQATARAEAFAEWRPQFDEVVRAHAAAETARQDAEQAAARATAQAAERAGAFAAQQTERDDAVRAYAAAQTAREEAERRAAQATARAERAEKRAARSAANGSRTTAANRTAKPAPASEIDARTEALKVIAANPDITGKELGEKFGMGERWGQLRKADYNEYAALGANGED